MGDDDPAADGSDDDDGTPGLDASTDDGDDTGDDVADDGEDDGGDDGGAVDVTKCRDLVTDGVLPGHHPARFDYDEGGEAGCVQNACHGASPGPAPAATYSIGGTVFGNQAEGRPVPGATVYVTDNNGVARALVTDQNGFFWSVEPLTPPFKLAVTAGCPDAPIPMAAAAAGNCNGGGSCHNAERLIFSER